MMRDVGNLWIFMLDRKNDFAKIKKKPHLQIERHVA